MENYIRAGKLSSREVEIVLNDAKKYRHKRGIAGLYSSDRKETYNFETRSGYTYFPSSIESKRTHNIMQSIIIEEYSNLEYDFSNISSIQYTRYEKGDKFLWHADVIPEEGNLIRNFTLTMNIAHPESYKGGELLLKHNKEEIQLSKEIGSYIVFPSFLKHQACEVIEGVRESLVVWVKNTPQELQKISRMYFENFEKE